MYINSHVVFNLSFIEKNNKQKVYSVKLNLHVVKKVSPHWSA